MMHCPTMQSDNNFITTQSYREIGKRLVVEELKGKERGGYGKKIIRQLAEELKKPANLMYIESILNQPPMAGPFRKRNKPA